MLYIMRHGRTDWNVVHKLQGRTDIPLNQEGREMARVAGEECRDSHFDVCYCSPLKRAKETAQLVLAGRDIPIIYDDRLMEMSFGCCEGMANVKQDEENPMFLLFSDPVHYQPVEGAESFQDLFARTGSFLKEIVEPDLKAGKDVLIVGHGAMNSSILCQVKHVSLEHFWDAGIPNCKLMKLI